MKKVLKSILLASLLILGATSLLAGGNHSHGAHSHTHEKISEQKAIKIAKSMRDGLSKKGTIADSWKAVDYLTVEKKMFGKHEEWVITFNNPRIEDKAKQTLYIFISLYGKVTGANYTGN